MLLQKLTLASAALLAAGLIAWGASAALVSLRDEPSKKTAASPDPSSGRKAETAVPQPKPDSLDTFGRVAIRGRVLGPGRAARPRREAVHGGGARLRPDAVLRG